MTRVANLFNILISCLLISLNTCSAQQTGVQTIAISKGLADLSSNYGVLTPAFRSNITKYTLAVPYHIQTIILQAKALQLGSTLTYKVNHGSVLSFLDVPVVPSAAANFAWSDSNVNNTNKRVKDGIPSTLPIKINLNELATISVFLALTDGTVMTYQVKAERGNAELASLYVDAETMITPSFTANQLDYECVFSPSNPHFTVFATAANKNTKIEISADNNEFRGADSVKNGLNQFNVVIPKRLSTPIKVLIRTTGADESNSQLVYTMQCQSPPRGFEASGDPEFTGFQGQVFRVPSVSGSIYNLYTSPRLQMNAEFMYYDNGCSDNSACVAQAGAYIKSIGLMVRHGRNHLNTTRINVVAGAKDQGLTVLIDGKPQLPEDSQINFSTSFHLLYSSTTKIVIHTSSICFTLTNSDGFLNQELELNDSFLKPKNLLRCEWPVEKQELEPHGLLGQTWCQRRTALPMGSSADYLVLDGIFGTNFQFDRFLSERDYSQDATIIDNTTPVVAEDESDKHDTTIPAPLDSKRKTNSI